MDTENEDLIQAPASNATHNTMADEPSREEVLQMQKWNSGLPKPVNACVHELMKKQSILRPAAPAVCAWDGELTFSELDEQAERLAYHLSRLGVKPEVVVGLCFDKSAWALVSMLAILKAGGAIVPLGTTQPVARVARIIQDCRAEIIVAGRQYAGQFAGLVPHIIILDSVFLESLPAAPGSISSGVKSHNAAVIIYTSGSTGVPKGVVLEHGALCTSMQAHGPIWGVGPETRALQFAAYTFDISLADIWTTLQHGGCVCVVSEDARMNNLEAAMEAMRVNFANLTPTVTNLIDPRRVPTLKTLILAGEAATSATLKAWLGEVTIFNSYGPAECSIVATCSRPIVDVGRPSNIGFPLTGPLWVVEATDHHRLCPIGAIGELLIEGPALARGYLSDSVKTAAAFVTNPGWISRYGLEGEGQRRMYRTGDLVRRDPDGSLIYIGRLDTQVKINGQRAELGEIEASIQSVLPNKTHTCVDLVTIEGRENQQILVAVMEMDKQRESESDTSKLSDILPMSTTWRDVFNRVQESLLKMLPSYMVPALYIPVKKLPLNPSGKLDRPAIRKMVMGLDSKRLSDYALAEKSSSYVSPSTDMEKRFQGFWSTVLGVNTESIGAQDSFFHLGGDSVRAMRLVSIARDAGIHIGVKDIFRNFMLADMAAAACSESQSTILSTQDTYEPFSLLEVPDREIFLQEVVEPLISPFKASILDVLPATDFQALCVSGALTKSRWQLVHLALDGKGQYSVDQLIKTCYQLTAEHDILRTGYMFHSGKLLQIVLKHWEPHINVYETGEDIEEATRKPLEHDFYRPPRLGHPFTQFAIIANPGSGQHRVVMRVTHAELDGVTIPYIAEAFQAAYNGSNGEVYMNFAQYVHHSLKDTEAAYTYWNRLLEGSTITQVGRPTITHPHLMTEFQKCPMKIVPTRGAKMLGNTTIACVVKAAWAFVLSSVTESPKVVFSDIASGRTTNPLLEKTMGCCANAVPMVVDIQPTWTVMDLLSFIQDQQLARIPFETVGFRKMFAACSNWPLARLTATNHLNIPPMAKVKLNDTGTEYALSMLPQVTDVDPANIRITSIPGPGCVVIRFGYLRETVSDELGATLLEALCTAISLFLIQPTLSLSAILGTKNGGEQPEHTNNAQADEESISQLVSQFCSTLDKARGLQRVNSQAPSSDMARFNGDVVDAARIAFDLQQGGLRVSVDEVLQHQTIDAVRLAAQKASEAAT